LFVEFVILLQNQKKKYIYRAAHKHQIRSTLRHFMMALQQNWRMAGNKAVKTLQQKECDRSTTMSHKINNKALVRFIA
jgi:hypothetical protein